MNIAAERTRGQVVIGAAVGGCGALVALAPSLAMKAALCCLLLAIPTFWWMLREPGRWLILFFVSALLLPPFPVDIGDAGPHIALLFAGCGLLIGLVHLVPMRMDRLSMTFCALFGAIAASVAMAAVYSGFAIAAASMARVVLFGISVYVFLFVRGDIRVYPHADAWRFGGGNGSLPLDRGDVRARPHADAWRLSGNEGRQWGSGWRNNAVSFGIVRVLFWAAAVSALFACLDFYFQFPAPGGYGPQFIWLDSGVFRRAQGVFYEASTLGNLCAFFLVMIAVALFRPRAERPFPVWAMVAGGIALASALVLSYSRASLVNVAVALTVLLWLQRKRVRMGRFLAATGIVMAAAGAILYGLFPLFARAYWLRISASFAYFFESPNAILSGRLHSWTILTQFLMEHPWHAILGIGYKTLPYSDFIGQTAIADNTYLSMLIETGIAGLCALLLWNVAVLRASYRAANSDDSQRSFCGTWMLCFWAGQVVQMFSADLLTYWRVLPVYTCVLALAVRRK
jgi:O-antigen ligase